MPVRPRLVGSVILDPWVGVVPIGLVVMCTSRRVLHILLSLGQLGHGTIRARKVPMDLTCLFVARRDSGRIDNRIRLMKTTGLGIFLAS